MKVAIVGSRTITDYDLVKVAIKWSDFAVTEIVSGGAKGVDTLAERYAKENKLPITIFKPDWNTYGMSAGFRRNKDIIESVEAVIVVWDGQSRGSKHSIGLAKKYNKPCYILQI